MALPQIRCQLHDHANQYDNNGACHINGTVEICMAIYLGMAMGTHCWNGGCFEECIWWINGTGESCAVQERLAMAER